MSTQTTQTTLQDVIDMWQQWIAPSNLPLFKQYVNLAGKQMTISGKWRGSMMQMVFAPNLLGQTSGPNAMNNGAEGYLTLPRRYSAVLGCDFDCVPTPTFTQWHQYVECGPGKLDPQKFWQGTLIDVGDGYPCQKEMPGVGTLVIGLSLLADAGTVFRIYAFDQNGERIYDNTGEGFNITAAFPTAGSNQLVSAVYGIEKPTLQGFSTLTGVVNGVSTQVALWEPNDTRPNFHKYLIQTVPVQANGSAKHAISVLGQRRWINVSAATDWLAPDDLNAWGCALRAVKHRNANKFDYAAAEWADCYNTLNDASKNERGGAQPDATQFGWGFMNALPNAI